MQQLLSLSLVSSLLLAVPSVARAQEDAVIKFVDHRESMAGVTRMRVVVEDTPALNRALPAAVLKEAVEQRLRDAGIEVDSTSGGRMPWLYVNVNAMETPRGFVYSAHVSFSCYLEIPTLTLDVAKFVRGETWSSGTIGTTPPNDTRSMRKSVDDQVTAFLTVYFAANPGLSNSARLR